MSEYIPTNSGSDQSFMVGETCKMNLPSEIQTIADTLFPEGAHPDPSMIRPDVYAYVSGPANLSFTYVLMGASYRNAMGYARYNYNTHMVTSSKKVFPRINTFSDGCLQKGDTYKFTGFNQGDMIIFFLDPKQSESGRFYSYIDPPFGNPDTNQCAPNGCIHSSWAYLTNQDITLFGFEDQSLGDADYNDFMFFITAQGNVDFNEVPPYEDGTLKVCNKDTQVSMNSYSELNCTQWGLLESTVAQSCLTYMSIPSGWTWAMDNDPAAHDAIIQFASSVWGYTEATCFLLGTNSTHGVGYTAAHAVCDPLSYKIQTIVNGTAICYNAQCNSRFVLKGANLGAACSSNAICKPSSPGSILGIEPSTSAGTTVYPSKYSLYLKTGTDQQNAGVAVSTSIQVNTVRPELDIMVLLDLTSVPTNALRGSVANSFKTILNDFSAYSLSLGLTTFKPDSSSNGYYSLFGAKTLTQSSTQINSWASDYINNANPSTTCTSGGNRIFQAVSSLMYDPAINWRSSAFHLIWVVSDCNIHISDVMRNAGLDTGIVPIFTSPTNAIPSSGWDTDSSSYSVPLSMAYRATSSKSNNWKDPFKDGASKFGDIWKKALAVESSDPQSLIRNIPTSSGNIQSNGLYTISYKASWPSSLPVNQGVSSYSASVRVMGRGKTDFQITFNHKPTMQALDVPVTGGQNKTLTFNPSDSDGNLLNIQFLSVPSRGALYPSNNSPASERITAGHTMPYGVFTVVYVPNFGESGVDNWNVRVLDGCEFADTTARVTITFANNKPVARDFSIELNEDSIWSANSNNNGRIDFAPWISDPDNPQFRQTLTVVLVSLPSPATYGTLNTWVANGPGTAIPSANVPVANLTRFVLKPAPSDDGVTTFTYKVNDGIADSNIATVTIRINPINHAPQLIIPVTTFVAFQAVADHAITGSIVDADLGDTVSLRITLSNMSDYSLKATPTGQDFVTPLPSLPFTLYSNLENPGGTTFPLTNFRWSSNISTNWETATVVAYDNHGLSSNAVTLHFRTSPANPPTWVVRPEDVHPAAWDINQGSGLTNLQFSATDLDAPDWDHLTFVLQTAPAHGTVRIRSIATPVTTQNLAQGDTRTAGPYVGTNSGLKTSFFSVDYVPLSTYFGPDSFSFLVRDPTGTYASVPATVKINVIRTPTLPISADATMRGKEREVLSTQLSLSSTNIPPHPVQLKLVSVNFGGVLALNSGLSATWAVDGVTTLETDGSVPVWIRGDLGTYQGPSTPAGNFTYQVLEPESNLVNPKIYVCQIYLEHVNHPPESLNQQHTIRKREVLKVVLPATDPDYREDPPSTLQASFVQILPNSKGTFYYDEALTDVIDGTGRRLVDRTFWYVSMDDFSANNQPLARYKFKVYDKQNEPSVLTYDGSITVTPAGDIPTFGGSLVTTTYQETPIPMVLNVGVETETGTPAIVKITSMPTKGTFAVCDASDTCNTVTSVPTSGLVVGSPTGRVVYLPRDYDWGQNFTSFTFNLTDSVSGATGAFTMYIHVIHVNKRPFIEASNFNTTAQTNLGLIVNESSTATLAWRAWDQDSLPGLLTTEIRVAFYTSQGFSLYTCTGTPADWLSAECTFDPSVPFAIRGDFAKNARKSLSSYAIHNSACSDDQALKLLYGQTTNDCEALFKMVFAPTPFASFTPYITISFTAIDDQEAESTTISVLIYVKAINTPPTIWSPALVIGGQGVTNPFLRDTSPDSPTYNNPVLVGDIDANGNAELLTISVNDGYSGELTWPESAPCAADPSVPQVWHCRDRIPSFNQWLQDIRFTVTSADRADITFTINDLGFTSDYKPSPNLTASSVTSVRLVAAIAPPKGNSSTLAIAVGVAAGAGLLLLGALGFFLRRAVAPPSDDYFAAATTPLSAAPQSPLYQPQNQERVNPLYKGA